MGYNYKWKPSKKKIESFKNQMSEIESFCDNNNISYSQSKDSYYFFINGQEYRVSNHTVAKSNAGAYHEYLGQIREVYHEGGEKEDVIYITAGKTRIIEIYNNLKAGKILDKKGMIKGV